MDLICRAMEKKLHISGNEKLDGQTWRMFEESAADKKVFLFGTGACADFFFEHHKDVRLEGIIDNDVHKQGFRAEDFLWEAGGTEYGGMKITSMDLLRQYAPDEILVLVTSINYYGQIISQLEAAGIRNAFVLLMLEANKRIGADNTETGEHAGRAEDFVTACCREPITWNKIVFYSFGTYSDHGKYITEALLNVRKDLDIVWFVNDMAVEVPKNVRKVYLGNSKRFVYEMETARIWLYNMPVPQHIVKRSGQIYIQTKHWASITLKKFYLDIKTTADTTENTAYWRQDSKKIDYIITGSDFDTQSSRRGFDFHKEVLQIGSPRSDAMFQEKDKKQKVYARCGLSLEKHMLLYAPTYRYDRNRSAQEKPVQEIREIGLDYEGVKGALEKRFGGEWYIALRLHPGHEKEAEKLRLPEYVVNLSGYEDGEEAAAACDIMISDYSSIMFEPAFVRKPVFLFATDKKEYIDREYDLLIDYDTLPFPIAESNRELIQNIACFVQADYEKALDAFMERYGVREDGHASERAAGLISAFIDKRAEEAGTMETIVLNKRIDVISEDADVREVEDKIERGGGILYVVDKNGVYLGCMTRREMLAGIRQNRLSVNKASYKLLQGKDEEERAKEIFDAHSAVYNLPVVDENGLLLYEYIREIDNERFDSARYWEERYKSGGSSGSGSYHKLARFKAEVLNDFICRNDINSVIEWGFGDGNQVNLLEVPLYTGYDVSETAWRICRERFSGDAKKEFRHYNGSRMTDFEEAYDMAISLDVLYHLVEDNKFEDYLYNLFGSSNKYVCIYSSDYEERQKAEHVKRRKFTEYIKKHYPEWELVLFVKNPYLYTDSDSNFYFYRKNL